MLGIVIPAYKRPECLEGALESLVNQTFKRFITIVVDDHSPEPLEPVVNKFKDRLHIIYKYAEENGGPGVARQIGLEVCYQLNLDLVMFLDSDDKLYPQAAARLTQEINRTFCDMVSANFYYEGKQGAGEKNTPQNKTWLHAKIFRIKFLKENGISFSNLRTNEDLAFCLKVTELTNNTAFLNEELAWIGYEKSSITRNTAEKIERISADYIEALYEVGMFLFNKNKKLTSQMFANIVYSYTHCQIGRIGNVWTKENTEKTKWLVQRPEFQEFVNSKEIINCFSGVHPCYLTANNKVIFFKQSFGQWLEEMSQ